jgi:membrane protease YdiL (CAAX protease family)
VVAQPDGEVVNGPQVPEGPQAGWTFVLFGIVVEGGLALLALGLGQVVGLDPIQTRHWRAADLGLGVVATGPMLVVFALCLYLDWEPLRRIRRFVEEILFPVLAGSHPLVLALLCAAAGFGEETLFRGFLQGWLDRVAGAWIAVVVSGLLFGLAHPITRAYIALAALLGLYLGALRWAGASLLVVVTAHALYDFVALLWLLYVSPPAPVQDAAPSSSPTEGAGFASPEETLGEDGAPFLQATAAAIS